MIATADQVVGAVQQMLALFDGIEGAFVYGSVAHGTARPGSDVDLFVVTVADLGPEVRARLHSAAEQLQRGLGYRPDPVHVVEVFSTARCVDALTGPLVLRATHMAAADGRPIDQITLDSDDLEILRALQGPAPGRPSLAGRRRTDRPRPPPGHRRGTPSRRVRPRGTGPYRSQVR